jgi:hypothetical protein
MTDNTPKPTPVTPVPTPVPVVEKSFIQSTKETLSSTFGPVSDSLSEYTHEVKVIFITFVNPRNIIRLVETHIVISLVLVLDIYPVTLFCFF